MYAEVPPTASTQAGTHGFCPHKESCFPAPCCHGNQESEWEGGNGGGGEG